MVSLPRYAADQCNVVMMRDAPCDVEYDGDVLTIASCLKAGQVFKNANLAATFEELATKGKEGFYSGRIAESIVSTLQSLGFELAASPIDWR